MVILTVISIRYLRSNLFQNQLYRHPNSSFLGKNALLMALFRHLLNRDPECSKLLCYNQSPAPKIVPATKYISCVGISIKPWQISYVANIILHISLCIFFVQGVHFIWPWPVQYQNENQRTRNKGFKGCPSLPIFLTLF